MQYCIMNDNAGAPVSLTILFYRQIFYLFKGFSNNCVFGEGLKLNKLALKDFTGLTSLNFICMVFFSDCNRINRSIPLCAFI